MSRMYQFEKIEIKAIANDGEYAKKQLSKILSAGVGKYLVCPVKNCLVDTLYVIEKDRNEAVGALIKGSSMCGRCMCNLLSKDKRIIARDTLKEEVEGTIKLLDTFIDIEVSEGYPDDGVVNVSVETSINYESFLDTYGEVLLDAVLKAAQEDTK